MAHRRVGEWTRMADFCVLRREVVSGVSVAGVEGDQLILHDLQLPQLLGPSGGIAAVQPLQGDQSPLFDNGGINLRQHQLEHCLQARVVEIVNKLVDI